MKEATTAKRIRAHIKKAYGGWWVKIHGGAFQAAGIPDLIGITRGKNQRRFAIFFALEVKLPGQEHTLTRLQSYTIHKINEAGGVAAMVTSTADADRVIREALTLV